MRKRVRIEQALRAFDTPDAALPPAKSSVGAQGQSSHAELDERSKPQDHQEGAEHSLAVLQKMEDPICAHLQNEAYE
jgi:hypothetical protein